MRTPPAWPASPTVDPEMLMAAPPISGAHDGIPYDAALATEPPHGPLLSGSGGVETCSGECACRDRGTGKVVRYHPDTLLPFSSSSILGEGRIAATGWQSGP